MIRCRTRRGYTLTELVVSAAASAILMAGLSSSLYVSSYAIQSEGGTNAVQAEADSIVNRLIADVQSALEISELTTTAITLTVADRDGDGNNDTLRYAWSGTSGDPLTYSFNSGTPIEVAADVQQFEMDYLSRYMEAGGQAVLFISGEPRSGEVTPTSNEQLRIDDLEDWGYTVTVASDQDSESTLISEAGEVDVTFISCEVSTSTFGDKGQYLPTPIVCERVTLCTTLGFGIEPYQINNQQSLLITADHEILSGWSSGDNVSITNGPTAFTGLGDSSTSTILATSYGLYSLMTLNVGDSPPVGPTITYRRVMLPWAYTAFDYTKLNSNGELIFQRSLEWATSSE